MARISARRLWNALTVSLGFLFLLATLPTRLLQRGTGLGGSGCSGLYRGLRLWAAAVTEAGSLDQGDVIAALDHARLDEGPGGPAAMVPGQHHARMHMYIGQAHHGRFEVVETLGAIDPQERLVGSTILTA